MVGNHCFILPCKLYVDDESITNHSQFPPEDQLGPGMV